MLHKSNIQNKTGKKIRNVKKIESFQNILFNYKLISLFLFLFFSFLSLSLYFPIKVLFKFKLLFSSIISLIIFQQLNIQGIKIIP
jgi:hypothetical protein